MLAILTLALLSLPLLPVSGDDSPARCLELARQRAAAYYDHPNCVHGLSCGDGCDGAGYYWKDDALDLACHEHKRCLERDGADRCRCHTTLRAFALAVVEDADAAPAPEPPPEPPCQWWELLWCHAPEAPAPPPPPLPPPLYDPCLTVVAGINIELVRDGCH